LKNYVLPIFPENPLSDGFEVVSERIEKNREEIERLLEVSEKSYQNFLVPFEKLDEELDELFTPIYHLNSVQNSKESQEVYSKILPILSEYGTEVSQDLRIFEALKSISKEGLSKEEIKVLENALFDFQLSGAELPEEKKSRVKEINLRLSELSNNFSQNLLDATNSFEIFLEREDIEGIPESDLEEVDGKYRFTLQMPSYIAYMTYGPNREIREKIYKAYVSRAEENGEVLKEILELRQEKAKILGFNSYAELSLQTKMANTPDEVVDFLNGLAEKSKDVAKEELEEIRNYSGLPDFKSFDLSYYSEKYRKEKLDLDEEAYRPYFEKSSVVVGLFDFLKSIFGVEFRKVVERVWEDSAETYHLFENGNLIGRLYLDLDARESKRGGAWMNDWQSHTKEKIPTAFVVANFPPKLLRHDDVVTLFHEMGHAIHHLFSKVGEHSISGTNGVEWDAVEFPSQFLENFAFESDVLKTFAKHYETGETLPEEMIERLQNTKNFQSALQMVRQLEFGLFDMKLHIGKEKDVQELLNSIREEISPLIPPSYNKFQNGFSHIFAGGYSAGYYSYKWAEVLSADMFYQFLENHEIAEKYKDIVLASGGSESMSELFKKVSDREPDGKYLLKLVGIEK
jgi:oligopeptidase A